MKKRKLSLY